MEATLIYVVKNHRDKEVFNGTYRDCRAWIREHRAEFYCRVEPMLAAEQPTMVCPDYPGQENHQWIIRMV